MSGPQRKRLISIGTFGTLFTLLVVAADFARSLERLENALYDMRLRRCQAFAKPATDKLVHVDVDDGALSKVGPWPWPRSLMADLIDEIARAGAKVIVLDILFSEARDPELVQERGGRKFTTVDHDARLADAMRRAGNVVVATSLDFEPPAQADPVREALLARLFADPEMTADDLAQAARATADPALLGLIEAEFIALRGQAVHQRIDIEFDGGLTDPAKLKARLLPKASARTGTRSPVERQFEEEMERVRTERALRRFTLPAPQPPPALLDTRGGNLPIARIADAAAYGGFIDYLSDQDAVVRYIPLAVWHERVIFPQVGLVAACVAMDVDVQTVRITDEEIAIPRPQQGGGDIVISTRAQPDGPYAGAGGFFALPLFGRTSRERGSWEQTQTRVSVMDLVNVARTRERLAGNDAVAAEALARVLDVTDPSEAEAVRAEPPSAEELATAVDDALDTLAALVKSFADIGDPTPEERAELERLRRAQGNADRLGDWKVQRVKLQEQLVAQRESLASRIGGRAVFVGSISTGAYDFVGTSIDARCPGVYLHGATFNAIMTAESWREAPRWVALVIALVMGFLTTALIAAFSPPKAAVAVALLAAGYAAINGFLLFDYGNLIVGAAGPLVAAGTVWAGVTLIQFVREIGERTRLTRRFRSYVDPTLVTYVIENPDQARLEAQEKELTVAFCDLAGFTTLSERLRTESAKMLGKYMETMVPLIRARQGYVNKFLGDGIMFFFGAPLENPDHAACAVQACLDMQAALVPFNADLEKRGLPTLAMRTGVSTGLMVVGDAGPSFASDYTVLGDAVNLAARMESANKATGTNNLVSGRTVELAGDRFLTRPIANLLVVGKKNSVWVHEVLAPIEAATEEQKRLAALTAAFVKPFLARDFEACLKACQAYEAAYGKSKVTDLYVAEAAKCLQSAPGDDFCGLITLQAK